MAAEKRRIVEEPLQPGASVAEVALAHSVNANLVHYWLRQYRQESFSGIASTAVLVPVRLVEGHESVGGSPVKTEQQAQHPPAGMRHPRSARIIQIELDQGRVRGWRARSHRHKRAGADGTRNGYIRRNPRSRRSKCGSLSTSIETCGAPSAIPAQRQTQRQTATIQPGVVITVPGATSTWINRRLTRSPLCCTRNCRPYSGCRR